MVNPIKLTPQPTIVLIRQLNTLAYYDMWYQRSFFICSGGADSSATCCWWEKRLLKTDMSTWTDTVKVSMVSERANINSNIVVNRHTAFPLIPIVLQYETRSGIIADFTFWVEVCGHEDIIGPTTTELDFHYERRSFTPPHEINPHQVIAANVF